MCVIIIKQKNKVLPREVAKTSARINPHGLGIIWLDTFSVTFHKSSEYNVLITNRPFIAHFRYATVGAINEENMHPFRCGANKQEWFMMNGTVKGIGNHLVSDSKVLANRLGGIPRHHWKRELEKHDCRFVTVNTRTRTFQMYNKDQWIKKEGVWYSKSNVIEENLVAVYGTLKKGYSNYERYLSSSKHIGSGVTKDKYPLVVRGLPFLIDQCGVGYNVDVDVFKVSDTKLEQLDKLEGHPHWYQRKTIPIILEDKILDCWVYFNNAETHMGREYHSSFNQAPRQVRYEYDIPETESYLDNNLEATPTCIECFNDLDFDGFSNYHCRGCDGWFTEEDVLMLQN
tara:strand:+ start:2414 stop:3442 length:1029 start_codon:yes stop_codon:yes gene_type:complete